LVGLRARAALVNSNDNDSPPQPPPPREPDLGKLIDPLRSELRSLRALVRSASDHRGSAELRTEVAALRKLVEGFAGQPPFSQDRGEPGRATAMVAPSKASVIVLVGPTGAGKTTTIAKLAARAALVDGVSVRLITLDSFRIGGVDQIRTYAELIGVPVDVAERPEDLAALLAARRRVRPTLTLIDTAGRSPRDHAAIAELARALHPIARHHPEVHLVAPAATSLDALARLADRYRALGATRLLVTKLDEHDTHPELVQMPGRVGLPITWVTTGQAVPEDLEQPDDARLHELAAPRNTRGAA
jgi:flagellar biosynthesis GTPase FlhF